MSSEALLLFRPPFRSIGEFNQEQLGPFAKIPREILLLIAQYLNELDKASLAFTCHALKRFFGQDVFKIPPGAPRLSLLKRLERSLPGHLLCHPCQIYHRRQGLGHGFPTISGTRCEKGGLFRTLSFYLGFMQGQEIMNRHFFGSKYGIPVENLERNINREEYIETGKITVAERFTLKIVDGKLFVNAQMLFQFDKRNKRLEHDVESRWMVYCAHIDSRSLHLRLEYPQSVHFECLICQCNISVRKDEHPGVPHRARYNVQTWHNLCSFRNPSCIHWQKALRLCPRRVPSANRNTRNAFRRR